MKRRFNPPGFEPGSIPVDGTPVVAFDPAFSPPFRVGWRTRPGGLFVVPGGGSREFKPERWWPIAKQI